MRGRGRGRARRQGVVKETALLHTLATKKSQPYALRRLMKDLAEIEHNLIPTVGVTARPQNDNMYIWHANLRGPENTPYEGGVFHLIMNFPTNYPHQPPTITLSTPIPHPCVQGSLIKLDMLDASRKGIYEGWTSGYSVLSILIQLQSFLFEAPADYKAKLPEIREAIKKANDLVLPEVGHKGPLSPWPPFAGRDKETDLSNFKIHKTAKELITEEMICFHTKLNYNESFLGFGVSISRLPRTAEIRSVDPTVDLLSLKAFMKEGVRHSLDNAPFTHWFPLFFGEKPEAILFLLRKSLNMVCQGSTKRKFDAQSIIDVFPKMIVTMVVNMMEQKEHTSLKALRMFCYIHRLFLLALDAHKELYGSIDESLKKFKSSEENRIKDNCPNLGNLLAKLTVSQGYKWGDIMKEYLDEQMDRQVFWIWKDIPEIETMESESEIDEDRINVSFRSTIVGYHLTLFFAEFTSKIVNKEGRSREQYLKGIDELYGRLPESDEEALQKICNEIRKVKDYYGYFKMLGIPFPSKKVLFEAIKRSIVNSRKKKYHGEEDLLNVLPEKSIMVGDYHKAKGPQIEDFIEGKGLLSAESPKWMDAVILKYSWVKDYTVCLPNKDWFTPAELAQLSDKMKVGLKDDEDYVKKKKAKLYSIIQKEKEYTVFPEYDSKMNWRELFVKLELEDFLEYLGYNPDFKRYYKILELAGKDLKSLSVLVIPKKNIKSGYHWLTSLLTKLPGLQTLKLYTRGVGGISNDVTKSLLKGVCNYAKAGGQLQRIEFNRMTVLTDHKLLHCLRTLPDLRVIKMNGVYVSQPVASALNKILTDFKYIRELDLSDCKLVVGPGKEIADGLMRAKQMEVLRINNNPSLGDAISTIVYNLAFSPKIALLDISQVPLTGRANDNSEAIYKLISISGSLKTLIMDNTNINNTFNQTFFKAIGNNKTLTYLSMNGNGFRNYADVGKAISMNGKKNGSLEYFSAIGALPGFYNFRTFLENLWISEYDHEVWYGDQNEASKMTADQKEKQFICKLKQLIVNNNNLPTGIRTTTLKYDKYATYPKFIKFLCENKIIDSLSMESCGLTKTDGEVLGLCLRTELGLPEEEKKEEKKLKKELSKEKKELLPKELVPIKNYSNLKILNLAKNQLRKEGAKALALALENPNVLVEHLDISGNKIGVSGAKAFAAMVSINKHLKNLNLFSNMIDVDGARALKEALKVNVVIEELDVGLNRLREKGVMAIAEGIAANKKTAIHTLGLRFNFISDDGINEFFNMAVFQGNTALKHLYLKGNYISEYNAGLLNKQVVEKKTILHVDIFQKMKYMLQEKLDRSIWVSPLWVDNDLPNKLKNFFEDLHKVGIVVDIRMRTGSKIPGKPKPNVYAIVEFAHVNSVARSLRVASKKQTVLIGNRFRIYKAGTRTQAIIKPPKIKRGR